jgi:hypothetical protein
LLAQQTSAPGTTAPKAGRDGVVDKDVGGKREHDLSMAALTVNVRAASGDNDVTAE